MVHFDGHYASVYFANFPAQYLDTLRNIDVNSLSHRNPKIKLCHTMRYNLMTTDSRTDFIKEFVALLRFVAAGYANIGHLRKGSREIHRATDRTAHIANEPVLRPPQEALTLAEELAWMQTESKQHTP